MNQQFPVYTVKTECQDCYKCVRECPVKAIKIEQGSATVLPELCIACGRCVNICPAQAKHVRSDALRAQSLLRRKERVYVSLAPSWVAELPGVSEEAMVSALRRLGFAGASETALGAQQVSAEIARRLAASAEPDLLISSACPVVVSFISHYVPDFTKHITDVLSPLLAHCKLLRQEFGDSIGIVFIGPCIGKKLEADGHPDLLDVALTFQELRAWLQEEEISFAEAGESGERFVPEAAAEGALYPIEGGMLQTIEAYAPGSGVEYVTLTGLENVRHGLQTLKPGELSHPLVLECLACPGGCVGGPCMTRPEASPIKGRLDVLARCEMPRQPLARVPVVDVQEPIASTRVFVPSPDEADLREALARTGKHTVQDELNCGGCGYDTCRKFAQAMLLGKAEPAMCLSYLRNLANKKANALLRSIPSGVVLVDDGLKVIECNEPFARMFGEDTMSVYEVCPGLEGASLPALVPFYELFNNVINSGEDLHRHHLHVGGRFLDVSIFILEPGRIVGAVIQDVTQTEVRRDQIAQNARDVIKKNLSTVQDIAFRLGEHMAETEILLRAIADDYPTVDPPAPISGEPSQE